MMGIYTPEQHDLYDGRFVISGGRVYQTGTLADTSPWDHMGDDGSNVRAVGGTVEIDVGPALTRSTLPTLSARTEQTSRVFVKPRLGPGPISSIMLMRSVRTRLVPFPSDRVLLAAGPVLGPAAFHRRNETAGEEL
jgi:hypothetical protein